jgi:hypothetical protein
MVNVKTSHLVGLEMSVKTGQMTGFVCVMSGGKRMNF